MNKAAFFILFVILMLPTYFMRYLAVGEELTIENAQWVLAGLYLAMTVVCIMRGKRNDKVYVAAFPAFAGVFDLFLPFIPLVPTVMFIVTIVVGMSDKPTIIVQQQQGQGSDG